MRRTIGKEIVTIILLFVVNFSFGQHGPLSGKVVDSGQKAIEGATVRIPNRDIQTLTDAEGIFDFPSVRVGDTLLFTCIGYEDTVLRVQTLDHLTVRLQGQEGIIQAVEVNTGYQRIPKERAVGSFETIGADQLQNVVSHNVLDKLEGQTSLLFDKDSNRPSITLRGINTFEGNTEPLIILDNFPYEGSINSINPMDVESITILKDASAASIWGARASNGVIVINTKSGDKGRRQSISFSSLMQIGAKPDLYYPNQIDSEHLVELERMMFAEGLFNSYENNAQRSWLSPVVESLILHRDNVISENELEDHLQRLASTDNREQYLDLLYRNSLNQQHHLSFSQRGDRSSLYLSGGFDRNRGTLDDRLNRYSVRLNHTFRPTAKIEWSSSVLSSLVKQRNGHAGYPEQNYHNRPYLNLLDDNGNEIPHYQVNRHYADEMMDNGMLLDWRRFPLQERDADVRRTSDFGLVAYSSMKYRPTTWIDFSLMYRFEMDKIDNQQLRGLESYYTRNMINTFTSLDTSIPFRNIPLGGIKLDGLTDRFTHNWRGQLNFREQWGDHSINALGGFEIRKRTESLLQTGAYGYDPETMSTGLVDYTSPVRHLLLGTNQFITDPYMQRERRDNFISGFFNAGYDFRRKYLLTISGRRDASNNFGMATNDRWNPMWSFGAGWNIHEESFLKTSILDVLKLRATYGLTGNMDPAKSAVTVLSFLGQDRYSQQPRAVISQNANNELEWETTRTLNLGADFSLWSRRISGHLEFYQKWNENLFAPALSDLTRGAGRFLTRNVGNMEGKGAEANLDIVWISNEKFRLSTKFLYNYNSYTVTSYLDNRDRISRNNTSDGTNLLRIREDHALYSIVSFPFERLDEEGSLVSRLDGQPSSDYNAIMNADMDNLVYAGAATPVHFGNAMLSFGYKRFNFNAIVNWKAKYYFRRPSVRYGMLINQQPLGMRDGSGDFARRWQNPGDEQHTTVPRFDYPVGPSDNIYWLSEATVEDGSHLRLQTINLTYTLPANPIYPVSDLNVGFNVANVGLLWTKNKAGIDPDYPSSIPLPRFYSINVQLQF